MEGGTSPERASLELFLLIHPFGSGQPEATGAHRTAAGCAPDAINPSWSRCSVPDSQNAREAPAPWNREGERSNQRRSDAAGTSPSPP